MSPIDYSSQVQAPLQAALQGYQAGAGIRDDQQQQQAIQQAQQAQQQLMMARQAALTSPTADNYSRLMLMDPKSAEGIQKAWTTRDTAQQQSHAQDLLQWGAAIKSGQPQVAANQMTARADALDQSNGAPTPESQALRANAQVLTLHPELALGQIQAMLSANPLGKTAADALQTFQATKTAEQQAPVDLAKKTADASKAQTDAAVAAATAPDSVKAAALANDKAAQEIAASQLAGRISELKVQVDQANSETQRGQLQLELQKLQQQQAMLQQTQGQSAQDSQDSVTQALQTLDSIKNHRNLQGLSAFFTGPGTLTGKVWEQLPGTDRNAFKGYVDSLKGQLGYQSLLAAKAASPTGASGFGALSEGELKLLSNLAGNLDTNSEDFPQQLASVEKYLTKMQSKIVSRPGLPTAGGAFVMNHPTYKIVDEGKINQLMKENPGTTRQQVLEFLQQGGGK